MGSTPAAVRSLRVVPLALGVALVAVLLVCGPPRFAVADAPPLSQGLPVTASSTADSASDAAHAVDGDDHTQWASTDGDGQWLAVDLGAPASVTRVVLDWGTAYAKAYQVQVSGDDGSWTTLYTTTAGAGGTQARSVTGTGRYVRLLATAGVTGRGFSLREFQVYGAPAAART